MTQQHYDQMTLGQLRQYVLDNREDITAFEAYVDRSKKEKTMIQVGLSPNGELKLDIPPTRITAFHHPREQDHWAEELEIQFENDEPLTIQGYLLRIYPERFNSYDAYLDLPMSVSGNEIPQNIVKVRSQRFNQTWIVSNGPTKSPSNGQFRGDHTANNPPAWVMGLQKENMLP